MFSVVIPLFNKRRYVRRAVDSVLGQTFRALELIVVDDGSTDGSTDVLADIADPRLRMIRQDNAGEGAARNRGGAEATAEWIAFLDADDMWLPDHLSELSEVVRRFPGAALVSTGNREIGQGIAPQVPSHTGVIREVDYFAEAARRIGFLNASSAAVRRTVFMASGGFGPFRAGADLECWARLALAHQVAMSTRVTSIYFRGTGGVMEQLSGRRREAPTVHALEDVSPAVRFLTSALRQGLCGAKRPSVEAYINGRLFTMARAALYRGDVDLARTAGRLSVGRPPMKMRVLDAALRLPAPAILAALRPYAAYRRLTHRIQRAAP
jgi:glycosyltransferase involved in cell wall biosynthesis